MFPYVKLCQNQGTGTDCLIVGENCSLVVEGLQSYGRPKDQLHPNLLIFAP